MKTLIKSLQLILFVVALFGSLPSATAQKPPTAKEAGVKNLINEQEYVFHAQYAIPLGGRQRYLTTDYILSVSKDTIISDLPYFGRAYSASVNPGEGGIEFTSTDFEYKLVPRKKGGWDVSIKLRDAKDIQQLAMTIFENGSASLQVSSSNRQAISYNGLVRSKKTK